MNTDDVLDGVTQLYDEPERQREANVRILSRAGHPTVFVDGVAQAKFRQMADAARCVQMIRDGASIDVASKGCEWKRKNSNKEGIVELASKAARARTLNSWRRAMKGLYESLGEVTDGELEEWTCARIAQPYRATALLNAAATKVLCERNAL